MAIKDKHPRLVSLGFAVPDFKYTQEQIFKKLGYPRGYYRLFQESGINHRYFWIDLDTITNLNFQQQQEEYFKGSLVLSREAIKQCLDDRSAEDIACVSYCSCTGFVPGPVIPHYLTSILGFSSNTYFCNIGSMGCEGGYPGLKRAFDFTVTTGKPSLVIACELSSCTLYPEPDGKPDPTNDLELMRSNAVFADAATAALVGYEDDWRHPEIIDTETYTDINYINKLGFVWQNGRLRVRLSRDVPELAAKVVRPATISLLKRNGLLIRDIDWFIIHAAGNSVIDNIRDALDIPEEKTRLSRQTLADYGNTSSTSVGITGKRLMSQNICPGDYILVLSVGPGMTGGATLLRFTHQPSQQFS
jgi:alkylresorcinol/alkylpyrone synthase